MLMRLRRLALPKYIELITVDEHLSFLLRELLLLDLIQILNKSIADCLCIWFFLTKEPTDEQICQVEELLNKWFLICKVNQDGLTMVASPIRLIV